MTCLTTHEGAHSTQEHIKNGQVPPGKQATSVMRVVHCIGEDGFTHVHSPRIMRQLRDKMGLTIDLIRIIDGAAEERDDM